MRKIEHHHLAAARAKLNLAHWYLHAKEPDHKEIERLVREATDILVKREKPKGDASP